MPSRVLQRRFYPDATNIEAATPVDLTSGENRQLDITLKDRSPKRVTATLLILPQLLGDEINITLELKQPSLFPEIVARTSISGRESQIDVNSLSDGEYALVGWTTKRAPADRYVAVKRFAIGTRVDDDIKLKFEPAVKISAGIQIDPEVGDAALVKAGISVSPLDLVYGYSFTEALLGTDFEIPGLAPGTYQPPYVALPRGWVVSRMRYGGVDLVDGPIAVNGFSKLEITATNRYGSVVGAITDRNDPFRPTMVALVPDVLGDSSYSALPPSHSVQSREVDDHGRYEFQWVAPGHYQIVPLYGTYCERYLDLKTLREHPQGYKEVEVEPGKTVEATFIQ